MADAEKTQEAPAKRAGGIFIPTQAIIPLLLAAASAVAAFIFVTKGELTSHAQAETKARAAVETRATVLEQQSEYHAKALEDLKETVKIIDGNVRTLMIEQGVDARKIERPARKE